MTFILTKIKNYPISVIYIIIIWVVCLIDVPETPLDNVRFIDKWTHIVMYLVLCLLIWLESLRQGRKSLLRLVVGAWLLPALMSGTIELAQAYCTNGHRSGDWLDFYANAFGCTLALVLAIALRKRMKSEE